MTRMMGTRPTDIYCEYNRPVNRPQIVLSVGVQNNRFVLARVQPVDTVGLLHDTGS